MNDRWMGSGLSRQPDIDDWSLKRQLLADARTNCAKQYEDLYTTFMALDGKAQTTAAIAGLQLAGIVGILQKGSLETLRVHFGTAPICLVLVTVLVLAVVIGACVLAMKVREVPPAFRGAEEASAVQDLVKLPRHEFDFETVQRHLSEYLEAWK